jgi:hypothetical protein
MKWFLDIPVHAKLLVGFGLIVVLLVVVTITGYNSVYRHYRHPEISEKSV